MQICNLEEMLINGKLPQTAISFLTIPSVHEPLHIVIKH